MDKTLEKETDPKETPQTLSAESSISDMKDAGPQAFERYVRAALPRIKESIASATSKADAFFSLNDSEPDEKDVELSRAELNDPKGALEAYAQALEELLPVQQELNRMVEAYTQKQGLLHQVEMLHGDMMRLHEGVNGKKGWVSQYRTQQERLKAHLATKGES